MITSLKITDNTNSVLSYLDGIKNFENGKEFNFRPGVNIIVGPNGSGKSTIINLIRDLTFCNVNLYSKLPKSALGYMDLFDTKTDKLKDGVDLKCDFSGVVYCYNPVAEMTQDQIDDNVKNTVLYINTAHRSIGEKTMDTIQDLFQRMFTNTNIQFPLQELMQLRKERRKGDLWYERYTALLNYYKRNMIETNMSEFEYTVLMDEPDRNLDIDNIQQLYGILSFHKPLTQLIVVIHNPVLIYKLGKLKDINFIETGKGYLASIRKFVDNK